ncbi:hypothetical protein [Paenibacillus sp. NAIST15-1]|uniref:hypothetical protein n=1 Tax=Paenibacillus sp. NAIST15-1 TaxID=1605994 RepID=UPI0008691AA7|nr:hypothetical protein [Paenibacillus sp. NAIST15-1]GAV13248.1 hypothetical protein PBN151_3182 [Paenibacillus sp. NAIST15-1]
MQDMASIVSKYDDMEARDIMTNEIQTITSKYEYDKRLRRYSDKHYFGDDSHYRKIVSKRDVELSEKHITTILDMYKKTFPLVNEDLTELEKAVGIYEISVRRVINLYGRFDFDYSPDELNELINKVFYYHDQVQAFLHRKLMQD